MPHVHLPRSSAAAYHGTPPLELLERYCRRHGWAAGPLARQVLLEDADGGGGQRALLSIKPFAGGDVVTAVSGGALLAGRMCQVGPCLQAGYRQAPGWLCSRDARACSSISCRGPGSCQLPCCCCAPGP